MAALRKNIRSTETGAPVSPPAEPAEPPVQILSLVSIDTSALHIVSPARDLQESLATRINSDRLGEADDTRKYPFKWTLIGAVALSLSIWVAIANFIF